MSEPRSSGIPASWSNAGSNKGIQGVRGTNSYLESILFAMFYSTTAFDAEFLKMSQNVRAVGLINEFITTQLRSAPHHCCSHSTFKACMQDLIKKSNISDVEDALDSLGEAFGVDKYIKYTANTKSNVHRLIVTLRVQADLQTLLERSMQFQNLKFNGLPSPALVMQVPESVGKPTIIPNLTLDLSKVLSGDKLPTSVNVTLLAIICSPGGTVNRYTTFVRNVKPGGASWLYFDSLGDELSAHPKVKELRLDEAITALVASNMNGRTVHGLPDEISSILNKATVYIYIPPQNSPIRNPTSQSRVLSDTVQIADYPIAPKLSRDLKPVVIPETPERSSSIGRAHIKYGIRKGIQGHNNSCSMDVLLFSMFYETTVFDELVLSTTIVGDLGRKVQELLKEEIVPLLRKAPHFCELERINRFRSILAHVNPKVTGQMIDVDGLIGDLFGKALGLPHFIKYTAGTQNFIHQILIGSPPQENIIRVDKLLRDSLRVQGLTFEGTPRPALFLKMPRSKGKLIGYECIVPALTLNTSQFGIETEMQLMAVICIKNLHYTTFVRFRNSESFQWIYFDSMSPNWQPEVKFVDDLESHLVDLNLCLGDNAFPRALTIPTKCKQILTDSHIYIYVPEQIGEDCSTFMGPANLSESLDSRGRGPGVHSNDREHQTTGAKRSYARKNQLSRESPFAESSYVTRANFDAVSFVSETLAALIVPVNIFANFYEDAPVERERNRFRNFITNIRENTFKKNTVALNVLRHDFLEEFFKQNHHLDGSVEGFVEILASVQNLKSNSSLFRTSPTQPNNFVFKINLGTSSNLASPYTTVQKLLQMSEIRFTRNPDPALVVSFCRSETGPNQHVLPNYLLNISGLIDGNGDDILLKLASIICSSGNTYCSFIKFDGHWHQTQNFQLTHMKGFSQSIKVFEEQLTQNREILGLGSLLMKNMIACVYVKPNQTNSTRCFNASD